jgi:hypothetical protein
MRLGWRSLFGQTKLAPIRESIERIDFGGDWTKFATKEGALAIGFPGRGYGNRVQVNPVLCAIMEMARFFPISFNARMELSNDK